MASHGPTKHINIKEKEGKVLGDHLTESHGSGSGAKNLSFLLTDAGAYSCAAIFSLALHELFDNQWDRKFNLQCISVLLQHLKLPKQVESVMLALLDGQGNQSPDAYIELLLAEPGISGKPILIVEDLLYLAVKGGKYDARMRVLIQHLSSLFKVPLEIVDFYEDSVVKYLNNFTMEVTEESEKQNKKRQRNKKIKRYTLIGLATLGGGAVLGLTGGLAAPLLVAGVETILGAGSIAVLGSTAGAAIIGSLFGVAGAGLTGFKMKKRVGEIEEFAFGILTGDPISQAGLHVTIAISGWLTDDQPDNFIKPWKNLINSREQYYLRYESQYLLELGRAMNYILNFAVSMAAQEALKYTILSGIITAIAWPASLVTLAGVIDNPWGVCCRRSAEVGKQLAEVLLSREQGQRPVTLIGYSLGARVIYYCLREMSEREDCEGIVQDAVLLGTPVTGAVKNWNKLTRVVSGRLINGYSKSDWLLKFLYRTFSMANGVAGLQPINSSNRKIINVDLTDLVTGHSEYSNRVDVILKLIKIRTLDEVPMTFDPSMKKSSSDFSHLASQAQVTLTSLRSSKSDEAIHVRR